MKTTALPRSSIFDFFSGSRLRRLVVTACALLAVSVGLHASEKSAAAAAKRLLTKLGELGWNVRNTYTTGLLRLGESVIITTKLEKGNKYKLVAGGCDDASDIDIAVFDENGELIAKDVDESVVSVADITPKWSGDFKVKVTMFRSTRDGAHYVLQYAWRRVEE